MNCANCGVEFSMVYALEEARRHDHGTFYCPNGHPNYFAGKTEQEKQIERLERDAKMWRARWSETVEEAERWRQALRHCPLCGRRISLGRTPEKAAERLRLHLVEEHYAQPIRLALTAGATT